MHKESPASQATKLRSRRLPLHEQRYGKTSKLCEATTYLDARGRERALAAVAVA